MKKVALSILGVFAVFNLKAQESERTHLMGKIDSIVNSTSVSNSPGGAIAIVSGEEVLYQKAFGMMCLEYQLPNSSGTLFNLASVSKHFTAFSILMLAKQGKLNLSDDIRSYLPGLPEYKHKVTIAQLIHHTSGIPSSDNLRLFAGIPFEAPWDDEDEFFFLHLLMSVCLS
ncbi:MAG: serine hydrolase [Bacteroidetes bacterium]|nr:serine hydrolase [Bacteroidota bacterium]